MRASRDILLIWVIYRIQAVIRARLNDVGWLDEVKSESKGNNNIWRNLAVIVCLYMNRVLSSYGF